MVREGRVETYRWRIPLRPTFSCFFGTPSAPGPNRQQKFAVCVWVGGRDALEDAARGTPFGGKGGYRRLEQPLRGGVWRVQRVGGPLGVDRSDWQG